MVEQAMSAVSGRRILIVEDEYIIAADLAQLLEGLGVTVIGPVGSVADALALLAGEPAIDAAVLDVTLGTEKIFPVADALRARGVPFVFATGYDAWIIPPAYADAPRFKKPVDPRALARVLSNYSSGEPECSSTTVRGRMA
ncbi:response regulator [Methylocystis echinoides]|uniref:response regulator n=1 Tax=Methylocystis echinoides TaxID=29468 RepID=UPI003437EBF0